MSYQAIGRIQSLTPPQTITTKSGTPFTFAEMCLGVVGYQNRTDTVFFRITGNAVSALGVLTPGMEVDVQFDIRCRNYQDKDGKVRWATDLTAWDVKPHALQAPPPQAFQQAAYQQAQPYAPIYGQTRPQQDAGYFNPEPGAPF